MQNTILYFAYGSNLLERRLYSRIGKHKKVRTHRLENYRLVFNCSGFANIEPAKGEFVEGVLYRVNMSQLTMLNRVEGFYNQSFFSVPEGLAVTYIGDDYYISDRIKPYRDYVNIILEGLRENNLKESYNQLVLLKEKMFKLTKGNKFKLFN